MRDYVRLIFVECWSNAVNPPSRLGFAYALDESYVPQVEDALRVHPDDTFTTTVVYCLFRTKQHVLNLCYLFDARNDNTDTNPTTGRFATSSPRSSGYNSITEEK